MVNTVDKSGIRSVLIRRLGAIAGRMACVLAAALLACASSAHAQVIEEGGFPVKGGGVSGEPFSLSCPPRLYVAAGESVLFSCSATAVPEEGVRYAWEPVSGDGLHLLSDAQVLAPLFTAPLSGSAPAYRYRLTAMGGVFRGTATVEVIVEGFSGESLGSPVVREECDPFAVPEGLGEGCAEDKGPLGFVPGPEEGFLFPEAPGLPDRASGPVREGGFDSQTPPRLECPSAVFLEELETGAIECHAWDASGEEYLEYSWEPVGSTTRDYLDNPLLMPEDSPTPSVVAPEAPVYETLESFRSGETTFVYRYRLTATSRATGLSSSSEVEVFVSSSRPSVYCPLEVVVEEGSTVALDCEGVDPLSHRMDYAEDGASILWEWEGLWATSTAPLDATGLSSPLFTAPAGSAGEEYHYIASMTSSSSGFPRTARRRVTVRVVGVEGTQAAAGASALAYKGSAPVITCNDAEAYEATGDFVLDCSVTDEPSGATYAWAARGSTSDTGLLSSATILKPTFSVPSEVGGADKNYYRVTLSASGIDDITEDVTVTVLEKPIISCIDTRLHVPLRSYSTSVYEASPDFELDVCEHGDWQGAPEGSDYTFAWTGAASALALLSDPMIEKPFFDVPVSVQSEETYEYTLTVSAENADAGSLPVRVVVQNAPDIRLICNDANVIEGDNNFRLDCSVTYEPVGATYSWTGTDIANRLSGTTILKPTFSVPDIYPLSKEETVETYEYTVTLEVSGSAVATEDITITVRNGEVLCWVSNDSVLGDLYDPTVDEGASDLPLLTCEAGITSAGGPPYTYSWIATGRINGREAEFLTATDQQNVSFRVPSQVSSDTEYAFYFKVFRASEPENDDEALFRITVANLDPVECHDPPDFVYDRAPPFALNCTYSGDSNGVTWEWDPTDHLTNTDTVTPTFTPPLLNQQQQDFPYTVRARVNGADIGGSEVTVRMLRSPRISVECDGYRFGPPVYQVYEGEDDFVLDCSASIDYGGSAFDYVWTGRNGTVVPGKLSSATVAKPTFDVPEEVTADEPYEYTLTVSAENVESGSVDVTVTVLNKPDIVITCPGDPYRPYERDDDIVLDCSASGAPSGSTYDYVWTGRNGTVVPGRLSSTTIEQPTFDVPNEVGENGETYEYTLAVSADNAVSVTEDVTVTVLNKIEITVTCPGDPYSKYEGEDNFDLDCSATGAPEGTTYEYAWTPRGNTPNTNNLIAGTDGPTPTFEVPENVDAPEHYYYYRLTVSAEGAEDAAASVTVTVRDKPEITVTCPGNPYQPYEGSDDIVLDCSASGGPSGSTYDYVWTERGSTPNTDKLSGTTILKPTFDVPGSVNSDEPYYYTLTASADNAMDGVIDVTVTVKNKPSITVACTGNPYEAYAGDDDIVLDCSASGGPSGSAFDYVWTGRNGTVVPGKLSSTTVAKPTFDVPGSVTGNETYEYTLTVSADNAEDDVANVTVNVLKKVTLTLVCTSPPPVYEGSPDFDLNCSASGAPEGSEYDYVWTGRGSTVVPGRLSSTTVEKPTFDVPEEVDGNETYEYTLTVSARGADTETANVTVRVLNKSLLTLICTPPAPVYEGAPDFDLDCVASGAPQGSTYDYVWTTRGATLNTDKLSGTDGPTPTFDVPEEVDSDETYEYTLTISAENADDASANVTVRVLNTPSLTLVCTPVAPVYEGAEDFDLDCVASGAPSGSDYDYVWTGRGSTVAPGNLSSATVEKPTFNVPPNVDADTDYEYTLTVSADNTESATEDVTVTVLNRKALDVVCATPSPVYEGSADFALDCAATGAPAGSDYAYVWTARGSTANTDLLIAGTDGPTPTFDVPEEVDEDETYEYLLTVSAENAIDATAGVTVKVLKLGSIALICASPPLVYEGSEDFELDCSISGDTGDADYTYEWTTRGATSNTAQLSATDISSPTFYVPDVLDETTTYEYLLTVSAENAVDATAEVTVTVLNRGTLAVACAPPPLVYEGSADFDLDCTASGAPQGSTYDYVWTTRGATLNTDKLSGTDGPTPTFDVPEEVDSDETYEYTLTISAENADDASANVTVRVLNTPSLTLVCTPVAPVYEGAEDFDLDCVASGAPSGSDYDYVWTGRGSTVAPGNLSSATVEKPTFNVPPNVDADTDYEYTLTVSADNTESATEDVTVTVLNRKALDVVCATPSPVYEGSADFALDCAATGAPAGSDYAYVWTARGSTANTDLLIAGTDGPTPTFDVPEEVDEDETYEYLLTVSAENAIDATAGVTVKVLKLGSIALICASPPLVYEGSEDFELDCSISGDTGDADYTYEWTARGATSNTAQLSATDISSPTFYVPDVLDETTTYEYLLTVSAENAVDATAEVTVTVLNRGTLAVACAPPPLVYEGSADFDLDCTASGAPQGSTYDYVWTTRGATLNTDKLSGTDGPTPTFDVPEEVDSDETYEYTLTISAENADDASANVTVRVLNTPSLTLVCTPVAPVYEGAEDFDLDCVASGAPSGSDYDYVWTGRGSTVAPGNLSSATVEKPTFNVPPNVDADTDYEYTLTVSADNTESATEDVTVTVLNRKALDVVCATPSPVYEGSADFALDCAATGAPAGSEYVYVWTGRGTTTNTDLLISGTDGPTPTFDVPEEVDEDETYEYLLTVSAENAIDATAGVTVKVLKLGSIALICASPPLVYEGSEDFELDCSISGDTGDADYTYEWTARGATSNTAQLSATDISSPTFYVPDVLDETTTYEYLLTVSAENAVDATAEVTVTVLNRGTLAVACAPPPLVYEGSADFALDCTASGAPQGSTYDYVWTTRGATLNTDKLSGTDGPTPTFAVPEALDAPTTYEYLLTVSAENAESGSAEVTVTVLNREMLSVTCPAPLSVYEGSEDFALDCTASGAPAGSDYAYVWTARGSTANTDLLIAGTDGPTPTFSVPDALDETTTYEYLLTVSAENAESGSAEVTVTVLNREMLSVTCPAPLSVYEGSEDFELDCSASGTRSGSDYTYAWTARGSTANTAQLSATDIVSPTFYVPDELDATTTYEYLLTASADNTISGTAEVSVTVLNREMLSVTCPAPLSVYEGSEDFELDCSASGTRSGSDYTYAWTARGSTANTAQLSATDIVSPTFYVPDELDATTTYEYLLTASADNTISGTAEVSVTVLNRAPLSVVCTYPGSIYEGSGDFALDCSASGAPSGSEYDYVWTARGGTANTDQLSAADISSPTFYVPEEVDVTTGHEYLLTASAENAEDGTVEVTVTVLNREMLSVTCEDTAVYEGEGDIMLDCSASGAPSGSGYTYVWMARGGTANTDLLIAGTDGPAPTFSVPDEVDENGETYEYLLTVSADNAEDASAEMTVNVLDNLPLAFVDDSIAGRVYVFTVGEVIADILLPEATGGLFPYTHILTPLLPRGLSLKNAGDSTWTIFGTPLEVSPRTEYTWQIVDANPESVSLAFFIEVVPAPKPPSRPVAEPSEALSLGVTVSVSSLRFGVQSADTEVSLDPMTDGISTRVSGPYHGGRMTLSPGGGEALDENGEMDLSIELASPVVLRREGGIEAASIVLSPSWSLAESCEQLSSQTIGALYTEVTLSDAACRLLLFGGELDLTGVPSGHYAGNMDVVLRSGENEETHSVEVDVTVIPAQQVITIGPRGVRFSTSRELPVGLTEEQNLSIYPHVVFLTEGKSHGVFELSNPSLIPLEVSVSARFGYTEATENGREVVVENTSGSPLGDLSSVVDIHPEVLVLQPGEKGLVRYGVKEGALAAMPERGYAAFFDVVSSPRQYVRSDQMPEEVTGDRTARVTMRVPGVYVPGEGASQLRAALLSISYVGSLSATFLLETQDHPFVGEVLAYDGEGRELGRRETLVYTRSRVRIRLDRVPEGGAVFLRFAPRGSERVPLPASVPWDAPRRDIGAADKDHTRPPQTLVQKP